MKNPSFECEGGANTSLIYEKKLLKDGTLQLSCSYKFSCKFKNHMIGKCS